MRPHPTEEPVIQVGLVQNQPEIALRLHGAMRDADGTELPAGDYTARVDGTEIVLAGASQ